MLKKPKLVGLLDMIYKPAEDSFLLEKIVRKYSRGKTVLDVGSGSGIQALTAIKSGAKEVLATDIDAASLRELKKNKISFLKSNLFSAISRGKKFDLIIFNPPYLPHDEREDLESARITSGGKKGDEIILKFLKDAGKHLEKKGVVLLVVSSLTPFTRIEKIMKENKFLKKIVATEKMFMERLEVWALQR